MAQDETDDPDAGWCNHAQLRTFTDPEGTAWQRRGDLVEGKALRRLVTDPAKRVVHEYAGQHLELPPDRREAFWREIEEKLAASPYAAFYGADFKNEARDRLVIVHEDC